MNRGRRTPLAAPQRHYPGFLVALFLILLRTAIGWHFFHEGHAKLYPARKEKAPTFSAEGYLRASTGPFAAWFRALIPDADARERLDPARLKSSWERDLQKIETHYDFDDEQRTAAQTSLRKAEADADAWFRDPDTVRKVRRYGERLDRLRALEQAPPSLSFERERADEVRKEVDADRREFVAKVDSWSGPLRESWLKLVKPAQLARSGPIARPWTRLDWINFGTIYGLMAVGLCLMFGLFTRAAALGAATYLLLFYLSMPPWPGLPEAPMVEGHYLYVNKNLIELLACLVLAITPNGLWLGLDALLFGWIGRRRVDSEEEDADAEEADAPVRASRGFRTL